MHNVEVCPLKTKRLSVTAVALGAAVRGILAELGGACPVEDLARIPDVTPASYDFKVTIR